MERKPHKRFLTNKGKLGGSAGLSSLQFSWVAKQNGCGSRNGKLSVFLCQCHNQADIMQRRVLLLTVLVSLVVERDSFLENVIKLLIC